MDFNELVGGLELGLFKSLPPDTECIIRGEGVVARLDQIINGSTRLDPNTFQLFFHDSEERLRAIRTLTENERVRITNEDEHRIKLEFGDFRVVFLRKEIDDISALAKLPRVSVFTITLDREASGDVNVFFVEDAAKDVARREINLVEGPVEDGTYRQMFKLARAGFDLTEKAISELPSGHLEKEDPAMNWLENYGEGVK